MLEFNVWSRIASYLVTLLFAFTVLSQSMATVVSFLRYPKNRAILFETLLELCILGHVMVCSLLHGHTREGYYVNLIALAVHSKLRIFYFIVIVFLALAVVVQKRNFRLLVVIAAAALTLPVTERLTGNIFAYLFVAAVLFWLFRSIVVSLPRYRGIRTGLSAFSVKNAIDTMNTGIMFCENNGFILLCNTQMQRLMLAITGRIRRNGRQLYALIASGNIDPRCRVQQLEGQSVILLPDGSAWKFAMIDIPVRGKKYIQLTATDISGQWKLTAELQSQNDDLLRRQEELKETIANLHTVSREKQIQSVKMRTHDILSERLTLMGQAMHNMRDVDYGQLRLLSQGMIGELTTAPGALPPGDEFAIIKQTFASFGVDIVFDGRLPDDAEKSRVFVDIAREAITNAVRHGFATRVYITAGEAGGECRLRITDNGKPPAAITEGGGISGMRHRLLPYSGELAVSVTPEFTVTAAIPCRER